MRPHPAVANELERIRAQILKDTYPRWSALAWARTKLLALIADVAFDHPHQRSKGVVREISPVGFEALSLRSVGDVSRSQAEELFVEVRYSTSVHYVGRVARKAEAAARSLHWTVTETNSNPQWKPAFQIVSLPLDVLVTFHSGGRFKEAELRRFGYGRGQLGVP
ncbi:MAG: hypothetical protein HY303_10535 [Candidatus Wallbacteria bacterium]|nr:hypothetical protein [Candidatus Wallbacteria bacterium]